MTENKKYIVKGTDDFFQHIVDTTLTGDKHEGAIYNIYQVVDILNYQDERIQVLETVINQRLNEQDKRIKELENENKQLKVQLEKGGVLMFHQLLGF